MNRSHRYITSLLMTAVYLLITFSPLAPLAMHSKRIARAVTGECSGDCMIDGCSLERSAAHTCCCWQSKKTVTASPSPAAGGHCGKSPTVAPLKASSCCPTATDHDENCEHDTVVSKSSDASQKNDRKTSTISRRPCGSGKHIALWGSESLQHLPYRFASGVPVPLEESMSRPSPEFLISRICDPPDPPPKLRFLS